MYLNISKEDTILKIFKSHRDANLILKKYKYMTFNSIKTAIFTDKLYQRVQIPNDINWNKILMVESTSELEKVRIALN